MFNVDRLLTRGGVPVPAGVDLVFADVRRELEAAGLPHPFALGAAHGVRARRVRTDERPKGAGALEPPDLSEKGGLQERRAAAIRRPALHAAAGVRRLPRHPRPSPATSAAASVDGVLYEDLNDPRGIAVLALAEDPDHFVDVVRPLLTQGPFEALALKPDYTMFGRTYALGYEPDLRDTLLDRPRRTVLNPAWRWAMWYPLRRSGRFSQLRPKSSARSSPSTAPSA